MIGKFTGNWASLTLILFLSSNSNANPCKIYENQLPYESPVEMIAKSLESYQPADLIRKFAGLRQLQLYLKPDADHPIGAYDLALQIPINATEHKTVIISADRLATMGGTSYDLNPFRTPHIQLSVGLAGENPISIPFSYLAQFEGSNPVRGVFIPKHIKHLVSFTSMPAQAPHLAQVNSDLEPILAAFLQKQKEVLWNGKPSPTGTFIELFRIARKLNANFDNAANYNIPVGDLRALEEGLDLEIMPQINRVLVFLRRFNATLGPRSPQARAMLERIHIEFLTRYINEYEIGKNYGGQNIQAAFKVPVGGTFYLSTIMKKNMAEVEQSFFANISLNGMKFPLIIANYEPKLVDQSGRKVTYQVETPILIENFILWPVRVLDEEFPPPEIPKSSYDEGDGEE